MRLDTLGGSVKVRRGARAALTRPESRVVSDLVWSNSRDPAPQGLRPALRALESGHVCTLYETRQQCSRLLRTYLEIGIERGERCLCVISSGSRQSTGSMLHAASARIHQALERGDIELATLERAYLAGEVFLTERAVNFWRNAGERAAAEGFTGLRGAVQVDRPLRRPETLTRWMEYENRLTLELAARGDTMLCLYRRLAQPAEFVLDALRAHPIVAHRGTMGENAFHVPPDDYNASDRAKRAADRMLISIRNQCLRDTASYRERQQLRKNLDRRLTEVVDTVTASAGAVHALAADSIRHKREERKLRRSMEYLAASQRISGTGSWAWNPSSRQLFWSLEHFRIFGLDPARTKVTYHAFFQMVHPEERAHVAREFEAAVRTGRDFDGEYRIVRPDGSVRYIHSRAHALCAEPGELTEYVGTVADVTDQRQQERSLKSTTTGRARASHAATAEQLMGAIAHEVNQPLTALITNAGAALRWLAGFRPRLDKARQALLQIVDDGNRASNVIARIRALLGRAEVERNPLRLNGVIQEVIATTRPELRRHGITLRTKLEKHLPPVMGDRTQIQQLVLNLIMNAIEAMDSVDTRSRLLLIETLADVEGVSVCVDDSGLGLDEEVSKHIFEPFYTTKKDGMGIGLAISRAIVEAHGGRLWAERKRVPGAIFKFRLPFEEGGPG